MVLGVELGVDEGEVKVLVGTSGISLVPFEFVEGSGRPVEVVEEAGHLLAEGIDAGGVAGEGEGGGRSGEVAVSVDGLDLNLVRLAVDERLELDDAVVGDLDIGEGLTGEAPGDAVANDTGRVLVS